MDRFDSEAEIVGKHKPSFCGSGCLPCEWNRRIAQSLRKTAQEYEAKGRREALKEAIEEAGKERVMLLTKALVLDEAKQETIVKARAQMRREIVYALEAKSKAVPSEPMRHTTPDGGVR